MNTQKMSEVLKQEFIRRCQTNQSYSVRAYAKSMDIDHSLLAKLLRGQRELSANMAFKVGEKLGFTTSKVKEYLEEPTPELEAERIEEDVFMVLADWYHFAILELVKTEGFTPTKHAISNSLDISEIEVDLALQRLARLGFIKVDEETIELSKPNNHWFNHSGTSSARKVYQKQLLRKAVAAVDAVDFSERINSSLTVAVDTEVLPLVREDIQELIRKIDDLSTNNKKRNHVYQLCVAFFPLTKE